ncbi:MAG: hypothetical protein AB7D00_14355 [Rhodospirillaceae bacterium]
MTPEELQRLIAGGESLDVEFKGEERSPLTDDDLVEPRGERKGRTWHLSAATYRRLGEEAAYVRQRGFEPLQQEQMVLQYVAKHGRITRREAAELCQLGPYQAYHLLKSLEERGMLVARGQKKGRYYERGT